MKDPNSLLVGVDIPEGFTVEVVQIEPSLSENFGRQGFAIFKNGERLAVVKTRRGLRIALMYFSEEEKP